MTKTLAQTVDDWFRNSPDSTELLAEPHLIDVDSEVESFLRDATPFNRDEIRRAITLWRSDRILELRSADSAAE